MVSFRSLLVAAPLLAITLAQNIAFTSVPAVLQTGDDFNITWGGGNSASVTLTLRRGNPNDLDTINTIASGLETTYYVWTVPNDLEAGDDYALQITQGQSNINYSGLFSITKGSSASNATTTTTTASSNSTMSITSMASASGTGTAILRNTTFSTASLTSQSSGSAIFGESTSTRSSSRTAAATSQSTSAPSNDAPIRTGSSAALILGIVAAVMLH